ncbi:MAG TPA: DUF1592 domain-containing protein [Polyangiaceae bacterium]|nr:DUF1592 domain-containing protein [Polyangiaceae bacterium]
MACALLGAISAIACDSGNETELDITAPQPLVEQRFSRLSHAQWENTVVDLLGLPARSGLSASFASDPLGGKAFDNAEAALVVSPSLWSDYQTAAETLAERVTSDTQLLAGVLPAPSADDASARARAFITAFGLRAYRRPLSELEIGDFVTLFGGAAALFPELDPFVAGVRSSIAAFLQAPSFIYRADRADDWAIASRLSYAIWNSMPDAELSRAASAGELGTAVGLHTQVGRLLASPRAASAMAHFFEQLYQSAQYAHLNKSAALYPSFSADVARDMQGELTKFTTDIYDHGGGLKQLLTSTTSFVTPRLAAQYGLAPTALTAADADGFSRVELDPSQRSGLLTRSGFLSWKGTDTQPSSIQRGVFIVRRILCQPLGNPPPAAQGKTLGSQTTNRKRIESLTGSGTCGAGCHGQFINPAGFSLEHFGALGEYRTQDSGEPIDSSGTYPLSTGAVHFNGAAELSRAIADSPQAHACYSSYLLEYLLGRAPGDAEAALAADLAQRSLSGASTRDLVLTVLESEALRALPTVKEPR